MDHQAQRPLWRRELSELAERLGALVHSLETNHPTFAGVVHQQFTRCGKPNCVCVREGRLHATWCVSFLQSGRRVHRSIPAESLERLQALATRYRTLRQQRATMNQVFDRLLEVFDRLERALRVPASRVLPRRRPARRSRDQGE